MEERFCGMTDKDMVWHSNHHSNQSGQEMKDQNHTIRTLQEYHGEI